MLYKELTIEAKGSPAAGADFSAGLGQIASAVKESLVMPRVAGRLTKTALHQAIVDGRYHQVKLLTASGSDVNAKVHEAHITASQGTRCSSSLQCWLLLLAYNGLYL